MPFYEYQCTHCDHKLEVLQKISDAPLVECPACDRGSLRKLVTAAAFRLKGTGWYETDFKNSGKEKKAASSEAATGTAKTDSGKGAADTPGKSAESTSPAA